MCVLYSTDHTNTYCTYNKNIYKEEKAVQISNNEIFVDFKGAVSRDFRTLFFSLIKPIWAPDKQAKMFFLKISFREDIRI